MLPITFLGGTYYQWTRLAPVKLGGWHWLQTVTCVNPLLYAIFLAVGIRAFRKRVLS